MLMIAGILQGDASQQVFHQFSQDMLRLLTYVHQYRVVLYAQHSSNWKYDLEGIKMDYVTFSYKVCRFYKFW